MLLVAATAWSLPFEPTTDPSLSTTKWYQIQYDGTYLYSRNDILIEGSTTPSTDDSYLWCFVGTEETGYKIFHRETQSYLWYGISLNGSEDEVSIDYVDLESENENSFYIYCIDHYYLHGQCIYVAVDQGNVTNVYGRVNSFTAIEVPVTPPPTVPGDVTGDGEVDIADVNAIINMMLGKATQTDAGDVTGDGEVDIADVNAVINIMLGKTTPVTPPVVDPTPQSLTATGYNTPHNTLDATGDEGYAKLVDGDRTTKWCVENRSGSWETIWIDLKSNVAFKPTSYILTTGNDTHTCPTRNPKNWKIYGRNSESESWTELVHVTDGAQAGLGTNNTTDYTFEFNGVTQAYQYYRFEVIENGGGDHWNSSYYVFQLGELTLVGVPQ